MIINKEYLISCICLRSSREIKSSLFCEDGEFNFYSFELENKEEISSENLCLYNREYIIDDDGERAIKETLIALVSPAEIEMLYVKPIEILSEKIIEMIDLEITNTQEKE